MSDLRHSNIIALDFTQFCDDKSGLLRNNLGRFYNQRDNLHLGSAGIRLLAKMIKESVLLNKVDGRFYSTLTKLHLHSGRPYGNVSSMNSMSSGRMQSKRSGVSVQSRTVVNEVQRMGNVSMMLAATTTRDTLSAPSQPMQS